MVPYASYKFVWPFEGDQSSRSLQPKNKDIAMKILQGFLHVQINLIYFIVISIFGRSTAQTLNFAKNPDQTQKLRVKMNKILSLVQSC